MDNVIEKNEFFNLDKDYSRDEIIDNIKSCEIDDFVKIFSIINLDKVNNQHEFNILINNLTNHPTPLREATSSKLDEINEYNKEFFVDEFALLRIADAIIDINPNISRTICNIIQNNEYLKEAIRERIIKRISSLLCEIEKYRDTNDNFYNNPKQNTKSHAKNKKLFSLYWYLEALSCCKSEKYNSEVLEILKKTIDFHDYTIREKTAKILAKMENIPFDLLQKAKQDQNFYVKYQVYDKIIKDN